MWLALFGGALTELTLPYNYQQFGTLTPQEMADACAEVINQWYADICASCDLPDGEPVMRLGEDGQPEQLIDGAWTTPTGDYAIPSPEARTEPTAEDRKCLAAMNAAYTLKLLYEEVTDEWGSTLGTLEAIANISVWLITFFNPAVGLTMKALALIALGAWKIAFDTVEFVTADFWTEQFDSNFKCALLRAAHDDAGVVTFDFDQVNTELITQINWFDPTAGSYSLAAQVRWLLGQITAAGLNLAGATTALTIPDCDDCVLPFCYLFDDSTELSGWVNVIAAGRTPDTFGVYSFGAWHESTSTGGGTDGVGIWIEKTFTPSVVTAIKIRDFDWVNGTREDSNWGIQITGKLSGSTIFTFGFQEQFDGGDKEFYWTGEAELDEIEIFAVCGFFHNPPGGSPGSITMPQIQIEGFGDNPFGADNCEATG